MSFVVRSNRKVNTVKQEQQQQENVLIIQQEYLFSRGKNTPEKQPLASASTYPLPEG